MKFVHKSRFGFAILTLQIANVDLNSFKLENVWIFTLLFVKAIHAIIIFPIMHAMKVSATWQTPKIDMFCRESAGGN